MRAEHEHRVHRLPEHRVPSPMGVSVTDLNNTLSMAGRRVALRFRDRRDEVLYAEVVEPLHHHVVVVTPWGTDRRWSFDARSLRSVMVALVSKHEEFAAICGRQRRLAREGRFS